MNVCSNELDEGCMSLSNTWDERATIKLKGIKVEVLLDNHLEVTVTKKLSKYGNCCRQSSMIALGCIGKPRLKKAILQYVTSWPKWCTQGA